MEDSARRTQQDLNLATRKAEQAGLLIYYSIFFVHFLIEDPIFFFPPFNFPLYFSATKETSNYCICEKMWKYMYIIYVYICKNHFFSILCIYFVNVKLGGDSKLLNGLRA